jgi:hypothetical protein
MFNNQISRIINFLKYKKKKRKSLYIYIIQKIYNLNKELKEILDYKCIYKNKLIDYQKIFSN